MVGSDVLVFPDTGPDFIRAVRMASLYANRVASLTLFLEHADAVKLADAFSDTHPTHPIGYRRLQQYFAFLARDLREIDTLRREGVMFTLSLDHKDFDTGQRARKEAYRLIRQRFASDSDQDLTFPLPLRARIERAFSDAPAAYSDLDLLGPAIYALERNENAPLLHDQELVCRLSFCAYLLMVTAFAEANGMTPMSWSRRCRDALWECRRHFDADDAFVPQARQIAEARIAQAIMTRYLPAVDDLNVDQIVRIREHRKAELEQFRSAIGEIAVLIDITRPIGELDLQVRDLLASRVDPSLRALRSAIKSSRLDVLLKSGKSAFTAAAAAVPATIAYAAGASLDTNILLALVGASAGTAFSMMAEREKLLNASQWGFLIRLPKSLPR